jgi:hypothetical protein
MVLQVIQVMQVILVILVKVAMGLLVLTEDTLVVQEAGLAGQQAMQVQVALLDLHQQLYLKPFQGEQEVMQEAQVMPGETVQEGAKAVVVVA